MVDHKRDLIIRGGLNVIPSDVEEVLMRHPAVEEAAVISVPNEIMGEEIKAFVVLKHGRTVDADEIIKFSQKFLAKNKTPKFVKFTGFLPKNVVGKVLRKELRKMEQEKRKQKNSE